MILDFQGSQDGLCVIQLLIISSRHHSTSKYIKVYIQLERNLDFYSAKNNYIIEVTIALQKNTAWVCLLELNQLHDDQIHQE